MFSSWSDGVGTASQSFTVNASGTLTATFETQYQLTVSASPASGGSTSPASGVFYNAGTVVSLAATPNSGYSFSGWTGAVANAVAAFTTVTMGGAQTVTANFKASAVLTPTIDSGGVVPLYSSTPVIQPGSWISIYGSNLANTTAVWNGNFPTSLGGVSVTIDNKPGYLWSVSPSQINLQAPDDTTAGTVDVVVTTAGGSVSSTVTLGQFGPSFLLLDGKHVTGIILRSNGSGAYGGGAYDIVGPTGTSLGYATVAAKAGDEVELFGVGFGPTSPAVPAGQPFSGSASTTNPVSLLINSMSVTPGFTGLASAGLYQINLTVPAGLGTGDVLLVANVGGVKTPGGVYMTLLQ